MSTVLGVATAHLDGLAIAHGEAAAAITSATDAAQGVDAGIRSTHGAIAASAVAAVAAAEHARRMAGGRLATSATGMKTALGVASSGYERADGQAASALEGPRGSERGASA